MRWALVAGSERGDPADSDVTVEGANGNVSGSRRHASRIESVSYLPQRGRPGLLRFPNDRQDIGGVLVGPGLD